MTISITKTYEVRKNEYNSSTGRENVNESTCENIHKKYLPKNSTILIPRWITDDLAKQVKYKKILLDYFSDLQATKMEFLELEDKDEEIKSKVEESNVIYLPGSETSILKKNMAEKPSFIKLLRSYKGTIVGNSAGALVLGKKYVDRSNATFDLFEGLQIIDMNLAIHYTSEIETQLMKLSKDNKITITSIDERSAILISEGKIEYNGIIVTYS